jgi:hypothetical protein
VSASLRRYRAQLFAYVEAGTAGAVDSAYQTLPSSDPDELWWCSKVSPTGRETTVGAAPAHHVDAVFGFAAVAPAQVDGAILCDGESFVIRAVLARQYGRDELQVHAERNAELVLATP